MSSNPSNRILSPDTSISYGYPQPDGWSRALKIANFIEGNYPLEDHTARMQYGIRDLGALAVDDNRYYGMGLAMRGMAEELKSDTVRSDIIRTTSERMYSRHQRRLRDYPDPPGLCISDMDIPRPSVPASIEAQMRKSLPPGGELLLNALSRAAGVTNEDAVRYAGSQMLVTALGITKELLLEYQRKESAARVKPTGVFTPIHTLISYDELRQTDFPFLALQAAGKLRLDQVQHMRDFFAQNSNGQVIINGSVAREFRNKNRYYPCSVYDNTPAVNRKQLLRCPALFVTGLIPTVMHMTVESLIVASVRADTA